MLLKDMGSVDQNVSRLNFVADSEKGPQEDPKGDRTDSARGGSPGDGYVIAAALLGVVLGGAVGFFVSRDVGGLFIVVLSVAGGVLLGGSVGALLGERLKARIKDGKDSGSNPE